MPNGKIDEGWTVGRWRIALLLGAMAIIVYLPSLGLPLISDDYPHTYLARQYGPVSGWPALASDALYRCRATSLILTYWTERAFGLNPLAFHLTGLGLHVLNVWLIFALGFWKVIGWRHSAVAAGFFAIHEGLQEAVIWYAAIHELIHFTFALLCVHCWLRWLASGSRKLYLGAFTAFVLALLSKESAVVLVPLMVLLAVVDRRDWRRAVVFVLPFAVLAVAYFLLVYSARATHLHFNDVGTFSLSAPFWITLRNSTGRLFWIWGWLSVAALLAWRPAGRGRLVALGAAWAVLCLLPYSFLTYMPRVPSRHTYLAAMGLALVVSAAFWRVQERFSKRPWVGWALVSVIFVHNCAYIWIVKQAQFLERAAPTERLVQFAAGVEGPVYIHCFPYGMESAVRAVEMRLGKDAYAMLSERSLSEIQDRSNVFCWTPNEHWSRHPVTAGAGSLK